MKRTSMILTLAATLLLAAGANATHWEGFEAAADCEGWHMDGLIKVASVLESVDVSYAVQLMQDGQLVVEHAGAITVPSTNPLVTSFDYGMPWDMELCGDFVATGHFMIEDPEADEPERSFEIRFTCECGGGGDPCSYTPGFWKTHEERWPITSFALGDVTYDQAALLEILWRPVRGDATVILAHHLIAAKLNVANGAEDSIQDAIDMADDLLVTYPLGSRPKDGKQDILDVKDELADYNEMECGGVHTGWTDARTDVRIELGTKALHETSSFSDLKARYR